LQVRNALHIGRAITVWARTHAHINPARGGGFNQGGRPENAVSLLQSVDLIRTDARRCRAEAAAGLMHICWARGPAHRCESRTANRRLLYRSHGGAADIRAIGIVAWGRARTGPPWRRL